jgi:hypothetical protein
VEEARAVLARLDRIETLERAGAAPELVLGQVRALLREAEAWVRAEPRGTEEASAAIDRCVSALSHEVRETADSGV